MKVALVVVLALGLSGAAEAASFVAPGTQSSKLRLIQQAGYHGAVPVPVPDPVAPVRAATRGSLLLLGLGLTGAGLVLGGAGFAVLYLCRSGTSCYADESSRKTVTTIGWVLAAPGIIPLVVGIAILYFGTGGGRRAGLTPTEQAGQWAWSAMPLSGGGMISGAVRF